MLAVMADMKDFTIYLDSGRYVVIEAEELKVEPAQTAINIPGGASVIRLRTDKRVVAHFGGANVIGWSEGNNPLKP
jgi:hypothetical protein